MARNDAQTSIDGDESREPQGGMDLRPWAPRPPPPGANGFQRALDLEQRAVCDALTLAPHSVQQRLTPLITDLYAILRTPIFPKGAYRAMGEALVHAVITGENSVQLYGVLASHTAVTEMRSFVHCATIFRRHGFAPRVKLLLVQWDNLVEMRHQDGAARRQAFARHVQAVTATAQQAGLGDAVVPVAVEVDADSAQIRYPADFRDWGHRVWSAVHDPHNASPALVRDIVWSTGFYGRQVSLRRLDTHQALLDLAIRRAVGQRVSMAQTSHPHGQGSVSALVTTELHKRFLPCYAASLPIININARERVRAASRSAVA